MDDLGFGRVIWLDVTDPQGNPAKDHAAVILTSKSEIALGKPIKAVVISSKLNLGIPGAMVMIKQVLGQPGGHPQTGLTKKCAAMCHWVPAINPVHIRKVYKGIYGKDLDEIAKCVADYQNRSTQS